MTQPELIALARVKATESGLEPELVCAICEQETGNREPDPVTGRENWNPWAIRYEAAFYRRYVLPLVIAGRLHNKTEARARAFSWGLMQVMGQTARESGYGGHLAALCNPETGIEIGCRVLAKKLAQARGKIEQGLLEWNGGTDRAYPASVLARVQKYSDTRPKGQFGNGK